MEIITTLIVGIIGTVIGGLIVLFFQKRDEKVKEEKNKLAQNMVGKTSLKIIDRDFLYNYEPSKVSIEKILDDFGQPFKKSKDESEEGKGLILYKYIFQNAKVQFSTYENDSDILSITIFSEEDKKNPITCRRSFDEDEEIFGHAKITDIIIQESTSFENFSSPRDAFAIIKAQYFGYPTIKYYTFCYQIDGNYETINDTKGQVIKQVCITQLDSICPTFSIWDTFYG